MTKHVQVAEGQGDEPRIKLKQHVIEFINSGKVPRPPAYNAYQCQRRKGHIIITIDIHPGVTPFGMACRYDHCPGEAYSMMYPSNPMPDVLRSCPLWLWYRPSLTEYMKEQPQTREHIDMGGLLLRKATITLDAFEAGWEKHGA